MSAAEITLSELHYNPLTGLETEFIEVMNIGEQAINLKGCHFSTGFTGSFPSTRDTILTPGQRTVVARSLWDINTTYGLGRPVAALFAKSNLNNGGELITLLDANGGLLRSVTYDNSSPWPMAPDGAGVSLTLSSPLANPPLQNPLAWRPSLVSGGTPGFADAAEQVFSGIAAADTNGNGYSDLAEYAFGNDGTRPPVIPAGQLQTLSVNGINDLYLTLTLRINTSASDTVIAVEASPDLETWSSELMPSTSESITQTAPVPSSFVASNQPQTTPPRACSSRST